MPPPTAPPRSSAGGIAELPAAVAFAAYRGLAFVLSPAILALLARRASKGKADAKRAGERYGIASAPRPAGRVAWMHAASVGETLALIPLTARIVAAGFAVVFTSGTVTSAAIAAERLPAGAVHQYAPLDIGRYVGRFLDHWRPEVAIIGESEVWPVTITALDRRRIPLVVVNGRLSDRSFPRWQQFRVFIAPLFARFSLVLAQSAEDGARFTALGAPRVVVSGNLKWDAPPLTADPAEVARLKGAIGARPVWLAASTHPGEEGAAIAAHRAIAATMPGVLTIIVPRHPQRGDEVAALLAAAGLSSARRSRGEALAPTTAVYLADTLGELGLFYRLAPVAFLGNSLTPPGGGHNPLEAVQLGAAVLSGPHVKNFTEVFARLDAVAPGGAVTGAGSLAASVTALLADPAKRRARAEAQATALRGLTGALDATLAALAPYLATREGRAA